MKYSQYLLKWMTPLFQKQEAITLLKDFYAQENPNAAHPKDKTGFHLLNGDILRSKQKRTDHNINCGFDSRRTNHTQGGEWSTVVSSHQQLIAFSWRMPQVSTMLVLMVELPWVNTKHITPESPKIYNTWIQEFRNYRKECEPSRNLDTPVDVTFACLHRWRIFYMTRREASSRCVVRSDFATNLLKYFFNEKLA